MLKYYICNNIMFLGGGNKLVGSPTSAAHYKYNEIPKFSKVRNELVPILLFKNKNHRNYAMVTPIKFWGNDNNIVENIQAAKYFASYDDANEFINANNIDKKIPFVKIIDSNYRKFEPRVLKKFQEPIITIESREKEEEKERANLSEDRHPRIQFSSDTRGRIYSKYNGICQICGKPVNKAEMTIDHIIPLAKGGSNEESNLQPAHEYCNQIKSCNTPQELTRFNVDALSHSLLNNPDMDVVFKLARSIVRGVNKKGVA